MTTPKRRWLRYSLRTLFAAVTLVGCWLGWQVCVVRQRQAFLAENEKGVTGSTDPGFQRWDRISVVRRWLGDEPQFWVFVLKRRETERAMQLFPEATLIYDGHP
jgi:hypothetical protein